MFDNLSEKLGGILDRLTRRGSLTEADVDAAMREVRRALLEADVALDVVRSFTEKVREQAVGAMRKVVCQRDGRHLYNASPVCAEVGGLRRWRSIPRYC